MNLHKVVSTLTIAGICILPLAVTFGCTGCTGPPRGTGNNTNTSQTNEFDGTPFSDDTTNTTN
ncbi:MAG: hypothetical protein QGG71_25130, partial [Pirellulaceae bacterium]|nr:hypothetical protein [Pirellulaceae bacterium]